MPFSCAWSDSFGSSARFARDASYRYSGDGPPDERFSSLTPAIWVIAEYTNVDVLVELGAGPAWTHDRESGRSRSSMTIVLLPSPIVQIRWLSSSCAQPELPRLPDTDGIGDAARSLAFLRVHRSAIVRLDQIAEVRHADSGRQTVILADGTHLTVSRGRASALRKLTL
jgi:hypothetical protein